MFLQTLVERCNKVGDGGKALGACERDLVEKLLDLNIPILDALKQMDQS